MSFKHETIVGTGDKIDVIVNNDIFESVINGLIIKNNGTSTLNYFLYIDNEEIYKNTIDADSTYIFEKAINIPADSTFALKADSGLNISASYYLQAIDASGAYDTIQAALIEIRDDEQSTSASRISASTSETNAAASAASALSSKDIAVAKASDAANSETNASASAASALSSKDIAVAKASDAASYSDIALGSINYKGDWSSSYNGGNGYTLNESISYTDGYNYVSKVDNNTAEPISKSDTNEWNWIESINPDDYYDKSSVDDKLKTDVPANAVFTDTTYTVKDGELSEKNFTNTLKNKLDDLDNDYYDKNEIDDKLKTDVPANAVFTDTTYTDAEIKTKYETNNDTNAFTDNEKISVSRILMPTTKSNNYTATSYDLVLCDTSSSAFTLTLPANPSNFDIIGLLDYKGSFESNNLTLGRNGKKIMNLEEDMTIDVNNSSLELIYIDGDWRIK
jgi:hypothetical protein